MEIVGVLDNSQPPMRKVVQGRKRIDLDMDLSVMTSQLRKAQDALMQYNIWFTGLAALALETKINNLKQARVSLVTLKRGQPLSHFEHCACKQ